jgi:Bacterial Ig-like domain (group 3)
VNFVDTFTPTGTTTSTQTTIASNVVVNQAFEAFTLPGISTFAAGTHSIVANYSGDTTFTASSSAAVPFTITATGTFTIGGTPAAVTTTPGSGTSQGSSTVTITPANGFSGVIAVMCGSGVPGVNCGQLSIPAGSTTGTLPINVNNPASAMATTGAIAPAVKKLRAMAAPLSVPGGKDWWMLSAGTGLATLILLLLPGRKRYRAAFSLGLICAISLVIGCGGGGSSGGGGGGVTPTTTQLQVTSTTKAAATTSPTFSFTATVSGGTPTGMVQLMDNGVPTGTAVAVSGGTASLTTAALTTVGTHAISANYQGSSSTGASSSGSLNVTVTGTTTLPITGTSGSASANANVSLMIN